MVSFLYQEYCSAANPGDAFVCVCVCVLVLALKWRCAVCNGVTLVRRSREQIQRWKLQLQRQRRRAFADIFIEEEKARTA